MERPGQEPPRDPFALMNWEGLVELKKINPLTPRDWPWPEILQTYTNGITLAKMIVIMFIWINYIRLYHMFILGISYCSVCEFGKQIHTCISLQLKEQIYIIYSEILTFSFNITMLNISWCFKHCLYIFFYFTK